MSLEAAVRADLAANDPSSAVTRIVRELGPELFSYLVAVARDEQVAEEAFGRFGEMLWRGLASWSGEALRGWSYAVARSALSRERRNRKRSRLLLTESPLQQLAIETRDVTEAYRRTTIKDAVRELRDQLKPADLELLVLRVDRRLRWKEIAAILAPEAEVGATVARLRKRFQRTTERLEQLAREAGLLEG